MGDAAGLLPVRGHASDLMALVDKERAVFSERCQQYAQTGILPPIGDLHAVLTNGLALIRLVANEPNLRLAFDAILSLTEIWQDERLWEGGVQVEVRHRSLAASVPLTQPYPVFTVSTTDATDGAACSATLSAPTTPRQTLPTAVLSKAALSPEKKALIQRNKEEALQRRDAKRAKTEPLVAPPDMPKSMIWM